MKSIKPFGKIAAILALCSITMSSCQDDTFEQIIPDLTPQEQEEIETPSAKDNMPWPLTPFMDTQNYRAADNFFMYCNGSYWNNTPLDGMTIKGFFETELQESLNQLKKNNIAPCFIQLEALQGKQLSNDEFYAFLKPYYNRIDGIKSYEDAFRLAGELKVEGMNSIISVSTTERLELMAWVSCLNPADFRHLYLPFLTNDHPDYVFENTAPPQDGEEQGNGKSSSGWDSATGHKAEQMVIENLLPALGLTEDNVATISLFYKWLETPLDELKAYMKFELFQNFAPLANKQGLAYMQEYYPTYEKMEDVQDWAYYQLGDLKKYLDSREVIEKYITPQLKAEVRDMCEEMRQAFINRIDSLKWMSSTTKQNAVRKIKNIKFYLGGPDRWMADSPDLSSCSNMVECLHKLNQSNYIFIKNSFGMQKSDDDVFNYNYFAYHDDLLTLNCYYNILGNDICIFPSFLLPPLYEANMHPALKYGMLMYVIGHELTHAVDATGAKYDENGEPIEWWTIQDKMDFEVLQQQLVALYNRLPALDDSHRLFNDGEKTLDENIADLGGVEIAHDAFVNYCVKQGFKGEDLDEMERKFFQGAANYYRSVYNIDFCTSGILTDHAFNKERVNGVVMNVDRWYELYNVQWGDFLYLKPENRIHIW